MLNRIARPLFLVALLLTGLAGTEAAAPPSLREVILASLPKSLHEFSPGKTTRPRIERALGKPGSAEKGALYYNLDGRDYDTAFYFKGTTLERMVFQPVLKPGREGLTLNTLLPLIPKAAIDQAQKTLDSTEESHEAGRYFIIEVPKEGLTLVFRNSSTRPLNSMEIRAKP